jgi:hypothetical protein
MDERSQGISKRFEVPILVAALLVIPVIVIEESNVSDTWKTVGGILNWAIWITFALEMVVMLAVVPSKWIWVRENPLEVANRDGTRQHPLRPSRHSNGSARGRRRAGGPVLTQL